MHPTEALMAGLRSLVADTDWTRADEIASTLGDLSDALERAVPAYVGLELTQLAGGVPVVLTSMPEGVTASDLQTSLRIPLDGLLGLAPGGVVVLYARRPGALVDLAADLAYALGPTVELVLDQHLVPTTLLSGVTGLTELSLVSRSIGMLIEQGHHPDDALSEIKRRATVAGLPLVRFLEQAGPPPWS